MIKRSSRECARILKAVADKTRLKIIKCLFIGEFSVTEIANRIGKNHSQVSHHLGVLRNSKIVIDTREGKYIMYKINPDFYGNFKYGTYPNSLDFSCCSISFNQEKREGK